MQRAAYRYKLYTCPDSCDIATDSVDTCRCSCDAAEIMASSMYEEVFEAFLFTDTFDDDALTTLLTYMCDSTVVMGDHATSSSPNDPR